MALKRDFFRTLIAAMVQIIVVFVTQALLARGLGAIGRGSFAACLTFLNLMAIMFSFGGDSSSSYYLASGKQCLSKVIGACCAIGLGGALLTAVVGYFLIGSSLTYFQKATSTEFYYAVAAVGPIIFYTFSLAVLRGTMRYVALNLLAIVNSILIAIATYVFVFLLKLDVRGAVLAYVVGAVVSVVITVYHVRHVLCFRDILYGIKIVPQILHYGARAYISYFAQMMNLQLGLLVMGFILHETEVLGFYSIAVAIISRTWIIPDSLYQVLMPRLANEKEINANNLCTIIRVATLSVIIASLALAAVIRPVIQYGLGSEFLPAVSAIYILLFGAAFRSISKIVTAYFFATDRPGTNSIIKFAGVGVSLVLLLIMVPLYGMIGCALADTLSYLIESWVMVFIFARLSKVRVWSVFLPQINDFRIIIGLVMGSVCKKKTVLEFADKKEQ